MIPRWTAPSRAVVASQRSVSCAWGAGDWLTAMPVIHAITFEPALQAKCLCEEVWSQLLGPGRGQEHLHPVLEIAVEVKRHKAGQRRPLARARALAHALALALARARCRIGGEGREQHRGINGEDDGGLHVEARGTVCAHHCGAHGSHHLEVRRLTLGTHLPRIAHLSTVFGIPMCSGCKSTA